MTDRRLQVFYEVARNLSFTKAAELLEMTQPAVTFQIRQLEQQYRARFFDRSHNRIDLTDAGRRALQYCERIFEIYQEMENSLMNVTGKMRGTLRIAAGSAAAQYSSVKLLSEYQRRFPEVRIQLQIHPSDRVAAMVENSDVDIGIVEGAVSTKHLKSDFYINEKWHLVASPHHPLAKESRVAPEILKQQTWILMGDGTVPQEIVLEFLSELGLDAHHLNVLMQISSLEAVKCAVEACQALTILPMNAIEKEIKIGHLTLIKACAPCHRQIHFLHKAQKYPLLMVEELLRLSRNFREINELVSPDIARDEVI